jgi:hypothetical protein
MMIIARFLLAAARRNGAPGRSVLAAALAAVAWASVAQEPVRSLPSKTPDSLTREQRLDLLRLHEAELSLEKTSNQLMRVTDDLDGMKGLFDREVVSRIDLNKAQKEYEEARLAYAEAQIELENRFLEFLRDATHIAVDEAKKYRTDDGKRWTEVTLRNAADVAEAQMLLSAVSKQILDDAELEDLLRVNGIFVSLMDDSIIGEPYEAYVDGLDVGESQDIRFQLLKDVEELTIALRYLGTNDQRKVFLKKEALQQVPTIASEQFSQEGKLGSNVLFDLALERLSEEEESFSLSALNLPPQITARFLKAETTGGRSFGDQRPALNQVKFSKEVSRIDLDLELAIPEKLDPSLVDRPLDFLVVVAKPSDVRSLAPGRRTEPDRVEVKDLSGFPCSYVELTLVPKGLGELDVLISNRYREIRGGEKAVFRAELNNRGTLAVYNIQTTVEPPYEWEYSVEPRQVGELAPGQRATVTLELTPPEDVGVGDYDVRLKAEGEVGSEPVESIEKNVTVRVEKRTHLLLNLAVVLVVMGLIVGIAVGSVRMTRR